MPTIEQVRRELAGLKILNSFHNIIAVVEQYLSSGGAVEKKKISVIENSDNTMAYFEQGKDVGWNSCLDAVRLAGWARVPSQEEGK